VIYVIYKNLLFVKNEIISMVEAQQAIEIDKNPNKALSTTYRPRQARFFLSKIPVHMVIRGHSRKTSFAEDEDNQFCIQWLLERKEEQKSEIYS
jgi:hypothetical protein